MRLASFLKPRLLIPILMAAALAQALPAGGQDLVEVGSMPYGPCYATAMNNAREVAFLGNGSVLQAVSYFDPYSLTLVGELHLPGAIHDLYYGGDRLYVANGHGGLRIITMEYTTDATGAVTKVEFTVIGSVVDSLTDARHLDIVNNNAYVANGRHGLSVVDVEDSTKPVVLGSRPLTGEALEVAVHPATARAYVAAGVGNGTSGLYIIDVQDSTNMQEIPHTYDAVDVSSVAVAGNQLYILDRAEDKGLCVVTSINTSAPVQHAYFDTGGDKVSVTVHNSSTLNQIAFVADGASGVCIVDITTPGSFQMKAGGFIGGGDHLETTPGSAVKIYATPGTDTALVADDNGGMRILGKAGSVEGLWEQSYYDTPGLARGIAISGSVAYIADDDGVRVYDISSPLAFPELGMVALTKDFQGIAASGNMAYVTASDGLHLVDATKPAAITTTPIFQELSDMDYPARKVAVVNDVLSMTNGDSSTGVILSILDVLKPTQPEILDLPSMPAGVGLGMAMDKNMTYMAGSDGLYAIDHNKLPGTIRPIASLNTSVRVAVSGSYAYVTDADGLCVLDVANAVGGNMARMEGRLTSVGGQLMTTVAVAGKDVYAVGDSGLHVIDVSDTTNPIEIETLTLPLDKEGDVLATSGNRVYAIAGAAGVRIYGVDREAPVANAGADISIFSGFTAYLKAEASTDDVAIVKYQWDSVDSNIELSAADTAKARFITPKVSQPTTYEFELTVTDAADRSHTDTMVVTVKPYTGRGESSGGSSGCTLNPEAGFRAEWLFLAGLMTVLRLRRRKR